jgi:hypothetical protein
MHLNLYDLFAILTCYIHIHQDNMKLRALLVTVCILLSTSAFAQHALQIDNGLGQFSTIHAPAIPGAFTLPNGGGSLIVVPTVPGPSLAWLTGGNILSGTAPNATERFGSVAGNAYDVIMMANGVEKMRLVSGGGVSISGSALNINSLNYTWPATHGTGSRVLTNDGAGTLTWAPSGASGPAGGDLTGTYPNPDIAAGAIVNADINASAAIAYSKLSLTNSIQNSDLVANSVTTSKVANGTVTTSKLADSAVSGLKLLTHAVTSNHILDGTIINADVNASAAIAYSKLNLSGSIVGGDIAAGTFTTTNAHHAIGNNDNTARELRLLEPSGSGVNYTAFKAQAQAGDITYTLPNTAPTSTGQVLSVQAVAGNNATLNWSSVGGGSIIFARTGVIANAGNTSYNVVGADDIIGVDMSAGTNFTINLQPATTTGEILIIKIEKYNNALLPVLTIQPNGIDKIDGANNLAFGNAGGNRRLYSDGAGNWYIW